MVLIAISFVFGPLREVTMGLRLTAGIVAGLIFHYGQQILWPAFIGISYRAVGGSGGAAGHLPDSRDLVTATGTIIMTIWRGQGRTHTGRRPANEDTLLCRDGDGLWAVIDGMGGHDAGDLAATMVRESLGSLPLGGTMAHRLRAVDAALQNANHAIRHHAAMHLRSKPMGATVVVLLIHGEEAAVLWAGDARPVRF